MIGTLQAVQIDCSTAVGPFVGGVFTGWIGIAISLPWRLVPVPAQPVLLPSSCIRTRRTPRYDPLTAAAIA